MDVRQITLDEYSAFIENVYHTPFHDVGMYHRLDLEGKNPRIYAGFLEDEIVIAMLVSIHPWKKFFRYMNCSYGYVAKDPCNKEVVDKFFKGVKTKVQFTNIIAIKMESFIESMLMDKNGSYIEEGYNNSFYNNMMLENGWDAINITKAPAQASNPQQCSVIDICEMVNWNGYAVENTNWLYKYTKDELLKKMKSNTKREIQRTQVPYIVIEDSDVDSLKTMCDNSAESMDFETPSYETLKFLKEGFKDKCRIKTAYLDTEGYQSYTKDSIEKLQKQIDKIKDVKKKQGLVKELTSQLDKEYERLEDAKKFAEVGTRIPLATSMFLYSKYVTFYMFSGIDRKYKEFHGSLALLWNTIVESLDTNVWQFNLLGIHGDYTPNTEGYSLFDYKRSLGARVVEYSGIYVYPINKFLYGKLMKDKMPY